MKEIQGSDTLDFAIQERVNIEQEREFLNSVDLDQDVTPCELEEEYHGNSDSKTRKKIRKVDVWMYGCNELLTQSKAIIAVVVLKNRVREATFNHSQISQKGVKNISNEWKIFDIDEIYSIQSHVNGWSFPSLSRKMPAIINYDFDGNSVGKDHTSQIPFMHIHFSHESTQAIIVQLHGKGDPAIRVVQYSTLICIAQAGHFKIFAILATLPEI
jgi:hypothetical protein